MDLQPIYPRTLYVVVKFERKLLDNDDVPEGFPEGDRARTLEVVKLAVQLHTSALPVGVHSVAYEETILEPHHAFAGMIEPIIK